MGRSIVVAEDPPPVPLDADFQQPRERRRRKLVGKLVVTVTAIAIHALAAEDPFDAELLTKCIGILHLRQHNPGFHHRFLHARGGMLATHDDKDKQHQLRLLVQPFNQCDVNHVCPCHWYRMCSLKPPASAIRIVCSAKTICSFFVNVAPPS